MSWKKALWTSCLAAAILLAPATLKAQGNYLDVYIAKVKPEKALEAEAIAKKITDANRHNGGDRVLVEQPVYGDLYTYVFLTQRDSYADVDKGNDAFLASLNKAFGKEGAMKVFADWNNCLVSAHSQLRVRRPDLSGKMPANPQSFAKLIGESRVLRTFVIHVRPGHAAEFEAQVKEINAHADKMPNTQPVLVSQVIEGENNGAYYITFLRKSLAGFDNEVMLKDILGDEGMAKFEKTMADTEQRSESAIYRFRPDLSYPPDQIAEVAADFWNPKPMMAAAARPKAKRPGSTEVAAKPDAKPQK
jgi:hypothetical protein